MPSRAQAAWTWDSARIYARESWLLSAGASCLEAALRPASADLSPSATPDAGTEIMGGASWKRATVSQATLSAFGGPAEQLATPNAPHATRAEPTSACERIRAMSTNCSHGRAALPDPPRAVSSYKRVRDIGPGYTGFRCSD